MINYHLGIEKDYKKPKENRSYNYHDSIFRQKQSLYNEARLRTFDVQVEDVGDLENHTIFVSEYRKEPCEVHVQDKYMNTADCSCHSFFFESLNDCIHVQAVKRLYDENSEFRSRFSRRRRETPLMVYDSEQKEVAFWGPWKKKDIQDSSYSEAEGIITDLRVFSDFRQNNPLLFSKQVSTHYLNRLRKIFKAKMLEAWVDHLDLSNVVSKTLYPFQEKGVEHFLRRRRAILADEMGLGKTIQTIGACEVLARRNLVKKVLVICPSSVKYGWKVEVESSTKNTATILHTAKDINRLIEEEDDSLYIIASYELIQRNLESIQTQIFDVVVLDEAQRIRNFESKIWGAVKKLRSDYLFVLSGTLIENKLQDLFAIMELIDPDVLGPRWKFEATYFRTNEEDRFCGYHNLKRLRDLVAPYIMRRTKKQSGIKLPIITETTRYCSLTKPQAELELQYRDGARKLLAMASQKELTFAEKTILNMYLLKARQACDADELCKPDPEKPVERSTAPKLEEFARVIEEIATDPEAKVLVYSEWIEMLKFAAKELEQLNIKYTLFTGSVPVKKRPAIIENFLQSPEQRVFLSTDAGGVGLNLQAASHVIHLDIPWNPARIDQRNGRVDRINQHKNCFVTYLVSTNGIERGIEGVLKTKRGIRSASLNDDSEVDEVKFQSFSSALEKAELED